MKQNKKTKKVFKVTPLDELKDKNKSVRFMQSAELASMAPNTIRTQVESTVTQGSNDGANILLSGVSVQENLNYNQVMSVENVHYSGIMSNGADNDAT